MTWSDDAACLDLPHLMDPRNLDTLVALCAECGVRPECAAEGLRFVGEQQAEYDAIMAERARIAVERDNLKLSGGDEHMPLRPAGPALYGVWGGVRVTKEIGGRRTGHPVFVGTTQWGPILARLQAVAAGTVDEA